MDSPALDLATKTLAAGIDALMAKGSPIQPVVIIDRAGQHEVQRIAGADGATVARQLAASQQGADGTAFAINGSISYGGGSFDGIVVEAWNFRTNRGARIGLRFELKGALRKKASLIGSPLYLGRGGWYDPEEGEPEPPPPARAAPVFAPPVLTEPEPVVTPVGFGPPPLASTLAPADIAPQPPEWSRPAEAAPYVEPPALPKSFVVDVPVVAQAVAPVVAPVADFGPPPSSPAVAFDPPPGFGPPPVVTPPVAEPPVAEPPVAAPPVAVPPAVSPSLDFPPPVLLPPEPSPLLDTAPPAAAHPVEVPPAEPEVVPVYAPVPIQRTDTPLGNRAMFAGIMELASKNRSFPAFAIVQVDGAWEQVTMNDANLAETATSVRAYARSRIDADFIAFAVDSYVSVGGVDVTAVVVEVWEYATRVSFSVAQRYVPIGDPPSPRLSGRPLMRTQSGWVDVPSSMMLGGQVQFGYRDPDPS